MTEGQRPRVLMVCGFFDWFSGYQEVGLASALASLAETTVIASDWVSPIFSDEHLERIGQPRRYDVGRAVERGVTVIRVPSMHQRAMVWSSAAVEAVRAEQPDLTIQVMPGQVLPAAATFVRSSTPRVVFYGDNAAMYAALSSTAAKLKFGVFAATKGSLYRWVNSQAERVYAYTPNTVKRINGFRAGRSVEVLPLAYDEKAFRWDPEARATWRGRHGVEADDTVILAAGKVQPQKRLDALVAAVGALRRSGAKVRLAVVGLDSSTASQALRAQVSLEGLDDAVLEGFQPTAGLAEAFNGADIGVWPAMPAITIQQAMGTGLPVVIPDNDLVGHLVTGTTCGRLLSGSQDPTLDLVNALGAEMSQGAVSDRDRAERAEANRWLSNEALARRILRDAALVDEHTP